MDIITSISVITTLASLIGSLITKFLGDKEKKKSESKSIEKELENLNIISNSLNNLKKFIDEQKVSLIENENTILELEKKKKELMPFVETQQQTVEAILKAHSNSQKRYRWFDYVMGFFIGVASSAIVTLIFYYFQNRH